MQQSFSWQICHNREKLTDNLLQERQDRDPNGEVDAERLVEFQLIEQ